MKYFYSCLFLLTTLAFTSPEANANRVIVKGHVRYANGNAAFHQTVTISTDSIANAATCRVTHYKITDSSGFYMDTLECSSNIVKLRILTANCNGTILINDPQVPASNIVESNFTLCNPVTPTPATCVSRFTFQRVANSLVVNFNSSDSAASSPSDNIYRRRWNFGDGDTLGGNILHPSHTYRQRGIYQACLTIWTGAGCEKVSCQTINLGDTIPPPASCTSQFNYQRSTNPLIVNFNSAASSGTTPADSIRRRRWNFGDGDTLGGNLVSLSHTYRQRGVYQACLTIWTVSGCEKISCQSITLADSAAPVAVHCFSRFTYNPSPASSLLPPFSIKFSSSTSETGAGDTIRERIWSFGDGTGLSGNVVDPAHAYAHDGLYTVCLTIRTSKGCQTQECKPVVVTANSSPCAPQFTYERIAPKKVRFNSNMSFVSAPDSIIQRTWNFGDGSVLTGNVAGPVKEYLHMGIYNVCLKIKTARGCENTFCSMVRIQDSVSAPPSAEAITILSISPNPATTQIQTTVWSLHNSINAELAVYDIYGVKKWGMNKVLLQGNNITTIPITFLLSGPYFFRVTTMYGVKSRQFYKL